MDYLFFFSAGYVAIFTIFALVFIIGFLTIGGYKVTISYLNQTLAKKKRKLNVLSFVAWLAIICWFILFLPFGDMIFGLGYICDTSPFDGIIIFGRKFTNELFGYYFIFLLFTIVAVKFAFKIVEVISLLKKKKLTVKSYGIIKIIE